MTGQGLNDVEIKEILPLLELSWSLYGFFKGGNVWKTKNRKKGVVNSSLSSLQLCLKEARRRLDKFPSTFWRICMSICLSSVERKNNRVFDRLSRMPSWSWRIEACTSTDSWGYLIDILNKKDTHAKLLAIMAVYPAERAAKGWFNTVD